MRLRPEALPTFLEDPRPVELAARLDGLDAEDAAVTLRCATERYEPELREYYGTLAETVLRAPTPGGSATLRVDACAPGILRVRYARGDGVADSRTPMVAQDFAGTPLTVRESAGRVSLTAAGVRLDVAREPLGLLLGDEEGRPLWRSRPLRPEALERETPLEWAWLFYQRYAYPLGATADPGRPMAFCSFVVAHDERLHGLGEGFGPLDKRFRRHRLWAREAFSNATEGAYKPVPFWLSTRGYGIFVNTSNELAVDLGEREHSAGAVTVADASALDLWLVTGRTPADVLARYGAITGPPRVPPKWSFGLWMGRISYASQTEVETVARELREHRIPCDVIHVDTNWFARDWHCDWRFAADRFPDPQAMTARLREQGFRVSVWQWPIVLAASEVYAEARAGGHLATKDDGTPALLEGPEGPGGLIDFTSPAAVAWYQGKLRALLALGVAAIKADFGEGVPADARWAGEDSAVMHNRYPLLYNRAVFEAGDTGLIWGRSGWAGSQRYPLHWSGDGVARHEDMPGVLRSALSFGLSGFPFYSHDIGGFQGVPTPELYVRWAQLGLFSSHARAHGRPPREPWHYGERAEAIFRRYAELRYRLLPYLYSEAVRCGEDGTPLVRPLLLDFPQDAMAGVVDDQYLLGRALLVAPILDAGEDRRAYLPPGRWVDFWSGEVLDGGRHLAVHAPLEVLPLWIRAGAVLPLDPVRQHTGEPVDGPLRLELCAPTARGGTAVHDDDGSAPLTVAYTVRDGAVRVELGARSRPVEVAGRGLGLAGGPARVEPGPPRVLELKVV